jgi:hypothetical protein
MKELEAAVLEATTLEAVELEAAALELIDEKEGKLAGFISDKVLTNLLVDELIIIKKYIKINSKQFKTILLCFTNISNFPR